MDISKYADMAKISLSESEHKKISAQVDRLIESFSALEGIDTDGIDVQVSVLDIKNVLRDDVAIKTVTRETLLSNAPEQYNGYFQVPKTLD